MRGRSRTSACRHRAIERMSGSAGKSRSSWSRVMAPVDIALNNLLRRGWKMETAVVRPLDYTPSVVPFRLPGRVLRILPDRKVGAGCRVTGHSEVSAEPPTHRYRLCGK